MTANRRDTAFEPTLMSDEELYDLVVQQLREYPEVDEGSIEIDVDRGQVTLSGRVGSDAEVSIAEHVLTSVIGIERVRNDLIVDALRRGEMPEGADDAVAADLEVDDQAGEGSAQHSDTSSHLAPDLHAETFGTHDAAQAVEEGGTYTPPDRPRGDGYGSRERH
jgi:hypothetical protein